MVKNVFILLFAIICYYPIAARAQESDNVSNDPQYYLHAMFGVGDTAVNRSMVEHWISFLSEADSIKRQSYWNQPELNRYSEDYAFFSDALFQYGRLSTIKYFPPYILSISKGTEGYEISTMFAHYPLSPSDTAFQTNWNPFCIVDVGIRKDDGDWKLYNLFSKRTQTFKKYRVGKINYLVDQSLMPQQSAMVDAADFCDSLSNVFGLEYDSIDYVVCESPKSLGYILGFNFFAAGYTSGKAFWDAKLLLSGNRNFNYRHELVHLVLPHSTSNPFYVEGLATYLGGTSNSKGENISFEQCVKELREKHSNLDTASISAIMEYPGYRNFYTLGGMLCEFIYQKEGIDGLQKLANAPDKKEYFIPFISKTFGISEDKILKALNKRLSLD